MARYPTGGGRYRDLLYGDDYRSYLVARSSAPGYRFGRAHDKGVRALVRRGSSRVNGYFKNLIEAVADAKLRRMERELELLHSGRPKGSTQIAKRSGSARQV
jgi:hypothetical protein